MAKYKISGENIKIILSLSLSEIYWLRSILDNYKETESQLLYDKRQEFLKNLPTFEDIDDFIG